MNGDGLSGPDRRLSTPLTFLTMPLGIVAIVAMHIARAKAID